MLICSSAYALSAVKISVEHMERDGVEAKNAVLDLKLNGSTSPLTLTAEVKPSTTDAWGKLVMACEHLSVSSSKSFKLDCAKNTIQHPQLTTNFQLNIRARTPVVADKSAMTNQATSNQAALNQANRIEEFGYEGVFTFSDASFTDIQGLHAGEKLAGEVKLNLSAMTNQPNTWHWQTDVVWKAGGVFWQPFYLESQGHHLQANGFYEMDGTGGKVTIVQADLMLKDIAKLNASAEVTLPSAQGASISFNQLNLEASDIDLAKTYPILLKPLLENGALNNLEMAGKANLSFALKNGETQQLSLNLSQADLEDKNGRFAFYKVDANIPWSFNDITQAQLNYQSGHLLHIPLGAAHLNATLNRYSVTAKQMQWPILDGALNVSDVSAAWIKQQWHWHMRAELTPIDMVAMSKAIGWQRMEGKVAASIPLVTYSDGELSTDGEMKFSVFNGGITAQHLAMQTPLGAAPRLTADLQMRHLDLGDLTRTFSFGAIEGKLDGDVKNLVLSNWQPVNFDADFHSSEGRYPKKISQRAVENISALGGAGAAAAVQRSFLRFLHEFNYEKIGLSCKLSNDTCEMRGIESTPQGYIIVKGSGIPAITVMGYNHTVGWSELLARVKRITADNAAVIK